MGHALVDAPGSMLGGRGSGRVRRAHRWQAAPVCTAADRRQGLGVPWLLQGIAASSR